MSHCLILQHDAAFGPGRIVPIFRDFGIPTRTVRLDRGEPVPEDFDEVRILVVLGGAHRVGNGAEAPAFLAREIEAIRPVVMADRPVLGFGMGAQLIARAAGAKMVEMEKPFYGWSKLSLPFPGGTDPILFGLHEGSPMFFWHKDSFELPKLPPPPGQGKPGTPPPPSGSVLLASAGHVKNAAFRFQERVYGFAFHPELDREDLEAIAREHGGMAGAVYGSGEVGRIAEETGRQYSTYERLGSRLLKNVVQFFKAYNPRGTRA